ncbi:LysR family transcriptional regulator [Cricetibacter osteomyelitidis]|uniref:LysR family transcriptional regulator n=1 Tax=Cricetibacter osteomyelitidis TaxID=1521931 RepID=A0A4R2T3W9_9PAST|nr:LysR family transcriptional regulator [Cricetibacter osteomyelitidis]TCP95976.1 LysR family transcriptional regulator [Cricetibacter osteomyelitidis]
MNDNKQFNDLYAFVQVASLGSFTQAAKALNVQPSALSHRMSDLESRLKIKLLNRTTRAVATTEAGQQLLERIAPMFGSIQQELSALADYTDKMSGKIRINCPERVATDLIYPKIAPFLAENPDIELEVYINNLYCDIVAERFDFGVRSGSDVAQDMVAVQISAKNTMAVVASPAYLAKFGKPNTLKALTDHRCIVIAFNPTYRLSEWEFIEQKQIHKIKVPESVIFNSGNLVKQAAINGLGLAWLPISSIEADLQAGNLVEVLSKSAITYPPMYLYYPRNKHKTAAMTALIELLRV